MIEADWNPNEESLARFGRLAPIGFGLLGIITAWKSGLFSDNGTWLAPVLIWSVGLAVFLLSWIAPRVLLPVYWILFGFGWIVFSAIGYLAMTLIFLLILTPIALFFRLIGRDALNCKPAPEATTYWMPASSTPKPKDTYFRQS